MSEWVIKYEGCPHNWKKVNKNIISSGQDFTISLIDDDYFKLEKN